jgi:tRNA threonylcarbamoyladenosine modification (KEOPS) complex Cgi121 subunit
MNKKTQKPNQNITIFGFSNVKIENINVFLERFKKYRGASVQFFDAKKVAGPEHLYFAALNALCAFKKAINISNNLAVEALLYASTQRQIKKAVNLLGIKQDSSEVAVLIITENSHKKTELSRLVTKIVPGKIDNSILEITPKKVEKIRKIFGISDLELEAKLKNKGLEKEALVDLVIERMALLGIKS